MKKFKKIRRGAALLLCAALLLTGCSGGAESSQSKVPGDKSYGEKTDQSAGEDKNQNSDLSTINILLAYDSMSEYRDDNGYICISAYYPMMASIVEDGYEKLQDTLSDFITRQSQEAIEIMYRNAPDMKEMPPEVMNGAASVDYISKIIRSDSKFVSILTEQTIDLKGAHPSIEYKSFNADPVTGKELKTSDIVTDKDAFYDAALEVLEVLAEEQGFNSDYEDVLKDMFETHYDDLTVYTDMSNFYLYFPAYTFGAFASGDAKIVLPLGKCTNFVKEDYIYPGGQMIIEADSEYAYDESGNSEDTETFTYCDGQVNFKLRSNVNSEYMMESIEITSDSQTVVKEAQDFVNGVHIVKTKYGGVYAYVEFASYDFSGYIEIYDIDGKPEYIGKVEGRFGDRFAGIPDDMTIYSYLYMLGSYEGFKKYTVGKDGMPVTKDTEHTLTNIYIPSPTGYTLTSKKDLTLDFNGKKETLPAGTDFHPAAMKVGSYAGLELEDGRIGRINVKYDNDDETGSSIMVQTADGGYVLEQDCFDGIYYIG